MRERIRIFHMPAPGREMRGGRLVPREAGKWTPGSARSLPHASPTSQATSSRAGTGVTYAEAGVQTDQSESIPSEGTPTSTSVDIEFPTNPIKGRKLVVMVDMEPDDMEAIIILFIELNNMKFSGGITFVVGGANAFISMIRLERLLKYLQADDLVINHSIVIGASDPLNLKDEYWNDLASDTEYGERVTRFSDIYKPFLKQRKEIDALYEQFRSRGEEIGYVLGDDFQHRLADIQNRLKTLNASVHPLANETVQLDKLTEIFQDGERYFVLCLKKPDELILLEQEGKLNIGSDSVLWYYTGQYNVKPAKHDVPDTFQKGVLSVLRRFKSVVIMSSYVVMRRMKDDRKRDLTALDRYKNKCVQSKSESLKSLNARTLAWNAAMYKNWVAKAGVGAQFHDLGKVLRDGLMEQAIASINKDVKGWKKGAVLNILREPHSQRVIADQLAVLLLFNRVGKHSGPHSPIFGHDGILRVDDKTTGNVFEIHNLLGRDGFIPEENDQAFTALDAIMDSVTSQLTEKV